MNIGAHVSGLSAFNVANAENKIYFKKMLHSSL